MYQAFYYYTIILDIVNYSCIIMISFDAKGEKKKKMVENKKPNVGARLRSLRESQGLSLRALAEKCGLSINAISLIERGENSPTVSSIHRLATALNVPITDFFQEEARQTMVFVKRNLGLQTESNGVVMESLGIGLYNQQLEPFLVKVEPGVANFDEPISHPGEEFVHCLEGKVEYCVGDHNFKMERGDSLLFDAMHPHTYRNQSQKPAAILMVFQASRELPHMQQLHLDSQ